MALTKLKSTLNIFRPKDLQCRFYACRYEYEIPETYRNAFYLANASLVDTTNWFVHNALGIIYPEVIERLRSKGHSVPEAKTKISSIMNVLEPCNHFIEVQFPVKKGNGEYETVRGFRAQHGLFINNRPCLGGLRLDPKIEKSDIRALAAISTYKYACVGIDLLGAHGGILVSPKDVQQDELQKIIQTYTVELTKKRFCGESIDIFEPDMNCGSDEMKWIIAANSKARGDMGNTCAVGKPVSFGGIQNREKAVAQGIIFGLDIFLQNRSVIEKIGVDIGWHNKTFIIQGLGNVGTFTARYFEYAGLKCVGIVEHDCNIYDPEGMSVQEAVAYKKKHGSLNGFKNYTKTDEANQVLTADCDILLLAATHKSLLYYIADKVKAKIIVEAANGPITPSVHKILVGHNKLVLPDIYINSGSSIASYFEYLQNIQHLPSKASKKDSDDLFMNLLKLSKDLTTQKLSNDNNCDGNKVREKIMLDRYEKTVVTGVIDSIMQKTSKDIFAAAKLYRLDLDFRTAAYINVVKRLFWATYKNVENNIT